MWGDFWEGTDCVKLMILFIKMKVMTMISRVHSELQRGPVRKEQRYHIQSFLAQLVCRERKLPVHTARGLPVSGGAPLLGRF